MVCQPSGTWRRISNSPGDRRLAPREHLAACASDRQRTESGTRRMQACGVPSSTEARCRRKAKLRRRGCPQSWTRKLITTSAPSLQNTYSDCPMYRACRAGRNPNPVGRIAVPIGHRHPEVVVANGAARCPPFRQRAGHASTRSRSPLVASSGWVGVVGWRSVEIDRIVGEDVEVGDLPAFEQCFFGFGVAPP